MALNGGSRWWFWEVEASFDREVKVWKHADTGVMVCQVGRGDDWRVQLNGVNSPIQATSLEEAQATAKVMWRMR